MQVRRCRSKYVYDAFNRLDVMRHFVDQAGGTDLVYDDGIDTLKASFDYEVDDAGNRTGAQEIVDGQTYTWTWTYDDLNRLISEQLDTNDDGATDQTTAYAYGANADLGSGYGGDGTTQTEKTVRDGGGRQSGVGVTIATSTFRRQAI